MAYNSVGTPRFIIDYLTWYNSLGLIEEYYLWNVDTSRSDDDIDVAKLIGLNPTSIFKAYSTLILWFSVVPPVLQSAVSTLSFIANLSTSD